MGRESPISLFRIELFVAILATAILAVAFAAVATAVLAATAATLLAFAAHQFGHVSHFLGCCFTALQNLAAEVELLACQWVVEVDLHLVVSDGENKTQEAVAVLVLQRKDGTDFHVLSVKLAIDCEDILVKFDDALLDTLAVCLVRCQLEVELLALGAFQDLLLKSWEGSAHAADEDERTLILSLLNQYLVAVLSVCNVIK